MSISNVQLAGADHRVGVLGVIYALFDSTPPQCPLPSTPAAPAAQRKGEKLLFEPIQVLFVLP